MENQYAILKPDGDDRRIALPDKNGLNFFDLRNIIRCQSDNSYTDFFILDETTRKKSSIKIVISKGFEHFEDFMTAKGFFYRVHNQHIGLTIYDGTICEKTIIPTSNFAPGIYIIKLESGKTFEFKKIIKN